MLASVRLGKINTCSPVELHLKLSGLFWMLVFRKDLFRCEKWRTCVWVSCRSAERVTPVSLACTEIQRSKEHSMETPGRPWVWRKQSCVCGVLGWKEWTFSSAGRRSLAVHESVCHVSGSKWKCPHATVLHCRYWFGSLAELGFVCCSP